MVDESRVERERELARILRFVDGTGGRPGVEIRLDRLERLVPTLERRDRDLEGNVKVISAHLEGHPLLDKTVAQDVVDHVVEALEHSGMRRAAIAAVGRGGVSSVFALVNTLILAWLVVHGIPISTGGH